MTSNLSKIAILSKNIVTTEGLKNGVIFVDKGIITNIVESKQIPSEYIVEDVGELVVMPGLIDSHVHINEPGRTDWEGFETATKSASAGGITTLMDMPLNSIPVTTTVSALNEKISSAKGNIWVDCGFYGGLIPGNLDSLKSLISAGVFGFKAFLVHSGIDDFPKVSVNDFELSMPIISKGGVPILVHAEIEKNHNEPNIKNRQSYFSFLSSRPKYWENEAIDLMIELSKKFNCNVHIVHLSSAEALNSIAKAKMSKVPVTVETCPHYLYFYSERISDGDTRFKCTPPIRENSNREELWEGLKNGIIDFIASDHSPCTENLKLLETGDFQKAWGGISSLQFILPIVWTEAKKRGFSVMDISEWMSRRPAELLQLNYKGVIAEGYHADFVIWNPEAKFTVERSIIHHKNKLTPYAGETLYGVVEKTFLRGVKIYENGNFLNGPIGEILLCK
jgi:allantoinase